MSPSPLVTPEDVLETLMNDGTIDAIRLKIINQLKANEELKSNTISMVEQSKVLNTPGAEKQTKRELFDALRRELETPVLEKASKAVWELIVGNDGLGKEISETVGKAFFRLSGQEPPQLPMVNGDTQPPKEKDDDPKETQKDKDCKKDMKDREKGSTSSASRKRTYEETSSQEIDAAANANTNAAAGTAENGMMLPPNEPNPKS